MAEHTSIWEALGFRKASGVGEAGWGRTLAVAIVSLIYFLPVLFIIFTALKPQALALSVPPTLSPTSFFGLIPDQYVFTPTLENFATILQNPSIRDGLGNSVVVVGVSVLLGALFGIPAAYSLARHVEKKKDDLQAVIALLKGKDFDFALQFTNYR